MTSDLASATGVALAIDEVSVTFPGRYGGVHVLDRINLEVRASECLAIVGESGCGKSLLGLATLGLLPVGADWSGRIVVCGTEFTTETRRAVQSLRGSTISMVYQDATTSLNPSMTIGAQLRQVLGLSKSARDPQELLKSVHLDDPERVSQSYPFELSGGQRQRALIALALARDPRVVVADEPTSALDVTIQAHLVELLRDLQEAQGFALVLISHDLALISQIATRVAVLYAGRVVEEGMVSDVLRNPRHPYTRGLVEASASLEAAAGTELKQIPGRVPPPEEFSDGCRFRPRCQWATDQCAERPPMVSAGASQVACFHPTSGSV
jgi:oligopeptide/dipeptide ABC transporter ATP-binding protein